jgi:hypothetical protein
MAREVSKYQKDDYAKTEELLLVREEVAANTRNDNDGTLLSWVPRHGMEGVAKLLLDR